MSKKKTKKSFRKKHSKGTKLFLRKKKKKSKKKARDRYKNLSEEEKEEKHQYHWDQNKNLSKEEKQKKFEYMRNYYIAHKKEFLGFYKVVWKMRISRTTFRISKFILTYKK